MTGVDGNVAAARAFAGFFGDLVGSGAFIGAPEAAPFFKASPVLVFSATDTVDAFTDGVGVNSACCGSCCSSAVLRST